MVGGWARSRLVLWAVPCSLRIGTRLRRRRSTERPETLVLQTAPIPDYPSAWRAISAPGWERFVPYDEPRRYPIGPPSLGTTTMGAASDGRLDANDNHTRSHRRDQRASLAPPRRDPRAQLSTSRNPGCRRRRGRLAPNGAPGDRAGRATARDLWRALHGGNGGDREPRQARAHPPPERRLLAGRDDPGGRRT